MANGGITTGKVPNIPENNITQHRTQLSNPLSPLQPHATPVSHKTRVIATKEVTSCNIGLTQKTGHCDDRKQPHVTRALTKHGSLLSYYVQHSMLTNKQAFPQILMTDLELLPLKNVSILEQKPIVDRVRKYLAIEHRIGTTATLEKEIDILVYKLYELTYDEVKVVEPDFSLSEEEYNNFKME